MGDFPAQYADGDKLTIVITTPPAWGTATVDAATGEIVYTADPAMPWGSDVTLQYQVVDAYGGSSSVRTITISTPANMDPDAPDIRVKLPPDSDTTGGISSGDDDDTGGVTFSESLLDCDVVFVLDKTVYAQVGTYNDGRPPFNHVTLPICRELSKVIDFNRTQIGVIVQSHDIQLRMNLSGDKNQYDNLLNILESEPNHGEALLSGALDAAHSEAIGPYSRPGKRKVIIVFTSGAISLSEHETTWNSIEEADRLRADGIRVDVVSCGDILVASKSSRSSFLGGVETLKVRDNEDYKHGCKTFILQYDKTPWNSVRDGKTMNVTPVSIRPGVSSVVVLPVTLQLEEDYEVVRKLAERAGGPVRTGYNREASTTWVWRHPEQSQLIRIAPGQVYWGGIMYPGGKFVNEWSTVLQTDGYLQDEELDQPFPTVFQIYIMWLPTLTRIAGGNSVYVPSDRVYGSVFGIKTIQDLKSRFTEASLSTIEGSLAFSLAESDTVIIVDKTVYAEVGTYHDGVTPFNSVTLPLLADLRSLMDFARSQISVIEMRDSVTMIQQLSSDPNVFDASITTLQSNPNVGYSSLAQALKMAGDELASSRHRTGARKICVLLTAGAMDLNDSDASRNAFVVADQLRAQGVRLDVVSTGDLLLTSSSALTAFFNLYPQDVGVSEEKYGCKFLIMDNDPKPFPQIRGGKHISCAPVAVRPTTTHINALLATLQDDNEYHTAAKLAGSINSPMRIGYNRVDTSSWVWVHPETTTYTRIHPAEVYWGGILYTHGSSSNFVNEWTSVIHPDMYLLDEDANKPFPSLLQIYIMWLPSLFRLSGGNDIFVHPSRVFGSSSNLRSLSEFKKVFKNMCGKYAVDIPIDGVHDPEGDAYSVTFGTPSHGTVTHKNESKDALGKVIFIGPTAEYSPNTSYVDNDSFTYTVTDARGGTTVANIEIYTPTASSPDVDPITADDNPSYQVIGTYPKSGPAQGNCCFSVIYVLLDTSDKLQGAEYASIFSAARAFVQRFDFSSAMLYLGIYGATHRMAKVTDTVSAQAWLNAEEPKGNTSGANLGAALQQIDAQYRPFDHAYYSTVSVGMPAALYVLVISKGTIDDHSVASSATTSLVNNRYGELHVVSFESLGANVLSLTPDYQTVDTATISDVVKEYAISLNVRAKKILPTLRGNEYIEAITQPANGYAEILPGGQILSFTYFNFMDLSGGTTTFDYTVSNGTVSSIDTITLSCSPPAPIGLTANEFTVNVGPCGSPNVTTIDFVPHVTTNVPPLIHSHGQGSHGSVSVDGNGKLVYTPSPTFSTVHSDTFLYTVTDSVHFSTGTINIVCS